MLPLWPHWRDAWVLHRDDDLLVVDKRAGVPTQASDDPEVHDLRQRLSSWLGDGTPLSLLHPADRDGSGVVLLGLRKSANRALSQQLGGGVERSWLLGLAADAEPTIAGVEALRLERRGSRALWRLTTSARSQPLRRQLAEVGVPAAGDRDNDGPPAPRLLVHVASTRVVHPTSGQPITFEAVQPAAYGRWLEGADERLPAGAAELEQRLSEALERRYGVASRGDTDAFRLVHGAGDQLPGVEVDLYGSHAVVALRRDEAQERREELLDAVANLGVRGVYLKLRPQQANVLVDTRREELAPATAVRGDDAPDPLWVREAGIDYRVRLGDGLSTGIFLDQRRARERVRALSAGKSVLNLFAYHGAFTVAAISGGAARTVSVDSSQAALEGAAANLAALSADDERHQLLCEDARDALKRFQRTRQRFDLVLLDPPSYASTKRGRFRADRDYRKLAAAALACLEPGGLLLACSNHRGIVRAWFHRQLQQAARDAKAPVRHMHDLPPPVDFPPAPGREPHLKCVLVELTK